MAYSAQTFTDGNVLTAAEMNQQQENISQVRVDHIGTSAPPELAAGVTWMDNTTTSWVLKVYDGSDWIELATFDTSANVAGKSGAYYILPGSDTDADLIVVQVTGTPTMAWDESEDEFTLSKGINVTGDITTTTNLSQASAPAFLATGTGQTNAFGDGTLVGVNWTEVYDQGTNFGSNTFTAPVTGKYRLNVFIQMSGLTTSSHATFRIDLITSNRTYRRRISHPSALTEDEIGQGISVLADMDASDTATVSVQVTGSTNDADLTTDSVFSGYLWSAD